jgi:hypothetical protein
LLKVLDLASLLVVLLAELCFAQSKGIDGLVQGSLRLLQ